MTGTTIHQYCDEDLGEHVELTMADYVAGYWPGQIPDHLEQLFGDAERAVNALGHEFLPKDRRRLGAELLGTAWELVGTRTRAELQTETSAPARDVLERLATAAGAARLLWETVNGLYDALDEARGLDD
jgi:hypothetical protein